MFAAEQNQAEQELPKSICQPRHVRRFGLALGTSCWRGDLSVTAGLCERKPLETATGYPEPCGVC
jgi:hypothetical protein